MGRAAGTGTGVRKCPRGSRRASARGRRHPRGLDATGRTGRGGGAAGAAREQGARSCTPGSEVADRAQLSPGLEGGRQGRGVCWGREERAHAHPCPQELSSSLGFIRAPSGFPFLFPLSRRSSASTEASRDAGLSGHVTRERPRWGGIRSLLPALRKRNTERACAMGAGSAPCPSGPYCAFCFVIGSGVEACLPFFPSHRFPAYGS